MYLFKSLGIVPHEAIPHLARVFDTRLRPVLELTHLAVSLHRGGHEAILASLERPCHWLIEKVSVNASDNLESVNGMAIYSPKTIITPKWVMEIFDHRRYASNPKIILTDILDETDKDSVKILDNYLKTRLAGLIYIKEVR